MSERRAGSATSDARRVIDAAVSEREFQALVVELARLHGWRCYWTHDSRHSPAGWPDLVLLRGGRMLVLELKTERGRLSVDQQDTLCLLRLVPGIETYVFRPSDWATIVGLVQRAPVATESGAVSGGAPAREA